MGPCELENNCQVCKKDEHLFDFAIEADGNGNENKMTVTKCNKKGKKCKKEVIKKNGFPSNEKTSITKCLSKKKCYKATVSDSGKDGICCDGKGGYSLKWNDELMKRSNIKNGKKESILFGKCKK